MDVPHWLLTFTSRSRLSPQPEVMLDHREVAAVGPPELRVEVMAGIVSFDFPPVPSSVQVGEGLEGCGVILNP